MKIFDRFLLLYTQSALIRNGPIRNTSEIFGFFKQRIVKFSKLRNTTGQFFQSKKQQSFWPRFYIVVLGIAFPYSFRTFIPLFALDFYFPFLFGHFFFNSFSILFYLFFNSFSNLFYSIAVTISIVFIYSSQFNIIFSGPELTKFQSGFRIPATRTLSWLWVKVIFSNIFAGLFSKNNFSKFTFRKFFRFFNRLFFKFLGIKNRLQLNDPRDRMNFEVHSDTMSKTSSGIKAKYTL